ncbi:MAG: enoyl-CoA hydratase/isomerase family protein [Leptospiraceae bacterium]|nr:enoyl-CoA hydratase/isomerase family protein [Leptospiraceae bacterium]
MNKYFEETKTGNILELKFTFNEVNALNKEAFLSFIEKIDELSLKKPARVVILTSGVEGFFSNGLDPLMFLDKTEKEIRENFTIVMEAAEKFFFLPIPLIVLLNGHCMGAGSVFAIYGDYRFMADKKARIAFPEALIGMSFPSCAAMFLQDLVGKKNTRELLFSGKALKGHEAKEIGLVDEVYPVEEIREKVMSQAQKIADLPPESSSSIKSALRESYRSRIDELKHKDIDVTVKTILSKNSQEGFRSILEKRRPKFE